MNKILIAIQIILIVFLAGCGDKSEYVGDLKNELPDGKGIMTYEDGSKYDGEWKGGQRNGKGTLTYTDGAKYEELSKRKGFFNRVRFYWFVLFASIRDFCKKNIIKEE